MLGSFQNRPSPQTYRKSVGKKAAEKWQKDWPELVTSQMMSLLAATGTRMLLTGDDRAKFVVQAFAEAIGSLEKQVKGHTNVKEELRTTIDEKTGVAKATKNSLIKFYKARVPCSCLVEEKEAKPKKKEVEEFGHCSFEGCGEKKPLARLSACAGCQSVTYCCVDCQRNDWPEHSKDCERLALEYQQKMEEAGGEYVSEEGSEEYDSEEYDSDSEEDGSDEYDSEFDDSGFEDSDDGSEPKKKKKDKKKKEKESKGSKKDKSSSKKEKSSKKDKAKKKDKKKPKNKAAQV